MGPRAPNFIKILVVGGFEGSRGAWGHHQSTRDEKISWGSYFVTFGWNYEGFMPILFFDESLGYAYSSGFKPFSIKSALEPITPPLKWILVDAASKVSMIFFNIASIQAVRCTVV